MAGWGERHARDGANGDGAFLSVASDDRCHLDRTDVNGDGMEDDDELREMEAAGPAPFYDEGLDDTLQKECDAARGGAAGGQSDALLSCALCFEVLAVCCRRLEFRQSTGGRGAPRKRGAKAEEWVARIEHIRNCRLEGEEDGLEEEEEGESTGVGTSEGESGSMVGGYCCRSCGYLVGRGFHSPHSNEHFVIFRTGDVLPSET